MTRRSPDLRSRQQVQVGANALYNSASASKFVPVSSDAKALDGLNVAVAVCDEIGSHKTSEVYDVLRTAMGKRKHPMLLCISTATGNNSGIGKQLWDYGVRVLEGKQTDDRLFCLSIRWTKRTTPGTRLLGSRPILRGDRPSSLTRFGPSSADPEHPSAGSRREGKTSECLDWS